VSEPTDLKPTEPTPPKATGGSLEGFIPEPASTAPTGEGGEPGPSPTATPEGDSGSGDKGGYVPQDRFNDVYGQLQATRTSRDQLVGQVDKLNQELVSLRQEHERASLGPEPDVIDDPDGWKAWQKKTLELEAKKVAQPTPDPTPTQPTQPNTGGEHPSVSAAKALYPDYQEVIQTAIPAIEADPVKKEAIMGAENPAVAAYLYGKELQKMKQPDPPVTVDNSGEGEADIFEKPDELTAEEEMMRDKFGMSKEQWIGQKKGIEADRARLYNIRTNRG
jgi:hypothetical protein